MAATGLYIATLIVANVTAGKLFDFYGIAISVGAFAYMACLSVSDIIVDVYGPRVGYRLVLIGTIMNIVVVFFYQIALRLPIISGQEWLQPHFEAVFASSTSVIIASVIGYPIIECFEVVLWKRIKTATGKKHMWLRNGAVKITSQLLDAMIFFNLAFYIIPMLLYRSPLMPSEQWGVVIKGALLYGLWKGCVLGTLDYPIVRMFIIWIRRHRFSDIPDLQKVVEQEKWEGNW